MSGLPWGKFFWKDWLTDPALSVCSLAAQGLWMRMLCIMSMSSPPGHLILPPTKSKESEAVRVARMCLADARQVRALLDELETCGVYARNDAGIITSRRMIRDAKLVDSGRNSARKRWHKPNGLPNGGGQAKPNGSDAFNPMGDTEAEAEAESPPTGAPHRKSRRKAARPNGSSRNAMCDIVTEELSQHAEADNPRSGGARVGAIAGHLVRRKHDP